MEAINKLPRLPSLSNVPSLRKILPVFSFLSGMTIVVILVSAVTNKVLALSVGTAGLGIMGLYRSLAGTVANTLTLGYTTIFMREASFAKTRESFSKLLSAGLVLWLSQALVIFSVALLFGPAVAEWLLGTVATSEQLRDVYVVLAMSWVGLGLQVVIAFLRGKGEVKGYSVVQIMNSLSTLILILPLLKLGSLGLAINVASGSMVALTIGGVVLFRHFEASSLRSAAVEGGKFLKQAFSPSLILTWQTLVTSGGILYLQTIIQKYYGLSVLGNFNAGYMIVETAVLILMASVRSYFLPRFAQYDTMEEKGDLLRDMVLTLLAFATLGIGILSVAVKPIVHLLFSSQFDLAAPFLLALSLSTIGAVFCWSYNTFLLHLGAHLTFVLLDTVWIGVLLTGSYLVAQTGGNPILIGWVYSGAGLMSACFYTYRTWKQFGSACVSRLAIGMGVFCLFISAGYIGTAFLSSVPLRLGGWLALTVLLVLSFYRFFAREREVSS